MDPVLFGLRSWRKGPRPCSVVEGRIVSVIVEVTRGTKFSFTGV